MRDRLPAYIVRQIPTPTGTATAIKPASLFRTCALAQAAVAVAPTSAHAADAPKFAWGKAGISYDQYRAEAFECAIVGLDTNIDNSEPVERLRTATRPDSSRLSTRIGSNCFRWK